MGTDTYPLPPRYSKVVEILLPFLYYRWGKHKTGKHFTPYEYYYSWSKANDRERVSSGISSLLTMIKGAFAKERITAILRDFVYYPDDSNNELAIVTRYPQYFAANKMLANIKGHLRPEGDGKGAHILELPAAVKPI